MTTKLKPYNFTHPVTGEVISGSTIQTFDSDGVLINEEEYYGLTAEEFLESVGFGGSRQPTLLYLRQSGAESAKLDAVESYLFNILADFASDSSAKLSWPDPPFSFTEVVGEAVASLSRVS